MTGEPPTSGPEPSTGPPSSSGASARNATPTLDPEVTEDYGTGGVRNLAGRIGWAVVGEAVNLVGTALLFFVLADRLGTVDWGSLQAVVSIALIAGPLATFGANWQLIRRLVVSDSPAADVGRAVSMATIGTGGVAVALLAIALAVPAVLPEISRTTMALVLVAQMPAYWLVELAATSAVSWADLRLATIIRIVAVVVRLGALAAFLAAGASGVDAWAWYFAIGNVGAAVAAHGLLARRLGQWPRLSLPSGREFTSGFPYGLGNTTEGMLAASDKPLLQQNGFRVDTGIYSAGYRIITLGFVPMMALVRAQDRRFFRQGAVGSAASHRAGLAMSRHGLIATVPVSVLLFLLAPQVDLLLAEEWAEIEDVIRLLAVLPIIKGFQFSFGNALTAAGNQSARMWMTGAAAAANFIGNLILIPRGSWRAAAGTTLAAELALTAGFFTASTIYARTMADERR